MPEVKHYEDPEGFVLMMGELQHEIERLLAARDFLSNYKVYLFKSPHKVHQIRVQTREYLYSFEFRLSESAVVHVEQGEVDLMDLCVSVQGGKLLSIDVLKHERDIAVWEAAWKQRMKADLPSEVVTLLQTVMQGLKTYRVAWFGERLLGPSSYQMWNGYDYHEVTPALHEEIAALGWKAGALLSTWNSRVLDAPSSTWATTWWGRGQEMFRIYHDLSLRPACSYDFDHLRSEYATVDALDQAVQRILREAVYPARALEALLTQHRVASQEREA